jgi:hypothetical protein
MLQKELSVAELGNYSTSSSTFHYKRIVFSSHKKLWLITKCEVNPLQCTICGVYCGIYYIEMAI